MAGWPGIICPACRAELNFDKCGDDMGVWIYRDFPEASIIQMYCRRCGQTHNIYLGETWEADCKYLSEIGLGFIVADRCPRIVLDGFRKTLGYNALSTSQLKEIRFFAYLLGDQYEEWWTEVDYG